MATTNTIRLSKAQREAIGVAPDDVIQFTDANGNARRAKVRKALKHQMASGIHTDTHAPVEVHDGPSPRPARASVRGITPHRVARQEPACADDGTTDDRGEHMPEGAYDALVEHARRWRAQGLTTIDARFELTFDDSDAECTAPIKSERSRAAYEQLIGATRVADVCRTFIDERQAWAVSGRVLTDDEMQARAERAEPDPEHRFAPIPELDG